MVMGAGSLGLYGKSRSFLSDHSFESARGEIKESNVAAFSHSKGANTNSQEIVAGTDFISRSEVGRCQKVRNLDAIDLIADPFYGVTDFIGVQH